MSVSTQSLFSLYSPLTAIGLQTGGPTWATGGTIASPESARFGLDVLALDGLSPSDIAAGRCPDRRRVPPAGPPRITAQRRPPANPLEGATFVYPRSGSFPPSCGRSHLNRAARVPAGGLAANRPSETELMVAKMPPAPVPPTMPAGRGAERPTLWAKAAATGRYERYEDGTHQPGRGNARPEGALFQMPGTPTTVDGRQPDAVRLVSQAASVAADAFIDQPRGPEPDSPAGRAPSPATRPCCPRCRVRSFSSTFILPKPPSEPPVG